MEHDENSSDDLRTRLHAMESKLTRIRGQRDSHNDSARSAADQRNSAHESGRKSTKPFQQRWTNKRKSGLRLSFTKPIGMRYSRVLERSLLERRELEPWSREVRCPTTSETVGEIERIEDRIMTDGRLTLKRRTR